MYHFVTILAISCQHVVFGSTYIYYVLTPRSRGGCKGGAIFRSASIGEHISQALRSVEIFNHPLSDLFTIGSFIGSTMRHRIFFRSKLLFSMFINSNPIFLKNRFPELNKLLNFWVANV